VAVDNAPRDGFRSPPRESANKQAPLLMLPRHPSNSQVNEVLERTETLVHRIQRGQVSELLKNPSGQSREGGIDPEDRVYANSYVDLGAAEVVGFDYDYTLVSYKPVLLERIYEMARRHLVDNNRYPTELLTELQGYDPTFAIRGVAVDVESAWICALTNRYRVSVAFYGRERVSPEVVSDMYKSEFGAGILPPEERRRRMRPLNDLFSTVEACLLADLVQWFKDRDIAFDARSVVEDVLSAVGHAHTSGDMHRAVAEDLDHFLEPDEERRLRHLLESLKASGRKTMLVSNSAFWYVDAGMKHKVGEDWRTLFDVVVVSAGKPAFYTQKRPFREVSKNTGRIKFKPITELKPYNVYCQGSIGELMSLTGWAKEADGHVDGSKVIYLGDSLFADLVEARRLYGWTTGAIISEVADEIGVQRRREWKEAWHVLQALVHCIQMCQEEFHAEQQSENGVVNRQVPHTKANRALLDSLEALALEMRSKKDAVMNQNFGSIFRTSKDDGRTDKPSLFGRSLQRYVDFYTSRVENLRLYSTDHRFYPCHTRIGVLHEFTHMRDPILELMYEDSDDSCWLDDMPSDLMM